MQYVFKLSGESFSIAVAELRALFEIFNFKFKIIEHDKNIIKINTNANKKIILKLCERSAFIKKTYLRRKIWEVSKGRFLEREPQKKPAFHPTSLKPKLARALVNLSRAKPKEILLDPFCGAGSVLIEAGILKIKTIGVDFDANMIAFSKNNLNFYKVKNYKLTNSDATQLEKTLKPNSISAIATDLPYGRSSRASLKNLAHLYEKFLISANKVLKKRKFAAIMYPHYINLPKLTNKNLWKTISKAELYVHGGLTRKIVVLRKI